ncbi:MAG: M23 family metallopeptidase [Bacillota bacterium]|jgi:murein DD-endopeptidase MepM/ murein hydrolase activator NlpD
MSENKYSYQYSFDTEASEAAPPTLSLAAAPPRDIRNNRRFLQILRRLGISLLCLLALTYIAKENTVWTRWTRPYLHWAVNASTGQTFGRFLRLRSVQSIMANSRELLRLEQGVTPEYGGSSDWEAMAHSMWPVQGRLIRRFGWGPPVNNQKRQFSKGIEVEGSPGGQVSAIQAGQVVKMAREPNYGWILELDHDGGWRSVYHHLDQVTVQLNQRVPTGGLLGKLKSSQEPGALRFELELYKADRLIDPLTIIKPD